MPGPRRISRLQQLILEVAAETVQRRLADPRLGFVTLTRVKLAPDLTEAVVYWSALGTDLERRTTARALSDAAGIVQSAVAKALATRTTPALTFRYDPTIARAGHLEEVFERLRRERGEPAPADAAAPPEGDVEGEAADGDPGDADGGEATQDEPPDDEPAGDPGDAPPGRAR